MSHNDYLVIILSAFAILLVVFSLYSKYTTLQESLKYLVNENNCIKKDWIQRKAKILSISFNTNYSYPYLNIEEINKINNTKFLSLSDFHDDIIKKSVIGKNINIDYGYIYQDIKYKNNAISLLPTDRYLELARTLNIGDIVKIYINPKDYSDTVMEVLSKEDFDKIEWDEYKLFMPRAFFGLLMLLLLIYGILSF